MHGPRFPSRRIRTLPMAFALGLMALTARVPAQAETPVKVDDAWVRATVKGQTASGGFMSLTSSRDLTLIGFSTPAAGQAELHDMVMEGDVMRMRAIDALPLPAGQAVTLKPGPGGKHLMLMDLKRQLKEGEQVLLKLRLRTADGKALTQEVTVPVRRMQATAPAQPASAKGAEAAHAH